MAKLRIMLGDLFHFNEYNTIHIPINIGYMASYVKKLFGSDVEDVEGFLLLLEKNEKIEIIKL